MARTIYASLVVVCVMLSCACTAPGHVAQKPSSETAASGWPGVNLEPLNPTIIADGRQVAERQCASCHAIDKTSSSRRAGAPPLRDVLTMYEADNLAYRFIEGMRVGHDEMPRFDFDVRSADALIAYIATISGADN